MCNECYKEYGSPTISNEKVKKGLELVRQIYSKHCTGGHLHIVLDDWNLEDSSLDFCEKAIEENDLRDVIEFSNYEYFKQIEQDCVNIFREMTLEERASVLHWFSFDDFYKYVSANLFI